MERNPKFMKQRSNIVRIVILLKVMYRFNIDITKITMKLFTKGNLTFLQKHEILQIAKAKQLNELR